MSESASTTPAAPVYQPFARRLVYAIAVLVICLIPTVVLYLITHEAAATWATGAGIAGVVAILMGPLRTAVLTCLTMGLIVPVAITAGAASVTGAALMALMCLMVGGLARQGLHRATVLVPVFMAWMIVDPPTWGPQHVIDRTDDVYLVWMAVIFFVGALFPVIVLHLLLRSKNLPAPKPHPRSETFPYTLSITILASIATFWVLEHPKMGAGAWLIATILVLAQVGDVGTVRRTVQRVLGTVLGSLVLALIVLQVQSLVLIYVIGLVFAIAALVARLGPHYWLYMALVTPTVVCLNASSSTQVENLGEQRIVDTVVGAALVLIASLVTIGYSRWAAAHGVAPTVETPLVPSAPAPAAAG